MKKALFLLFASLVLLSGCGTTTIYVNRNDVDIYINGASKGKGTVEVRRMGPPKKMNIEAKYQGKPIGEIKVKRKYDFVSFVVTVYTYGTGLFFSWRYPETIIVPVRDVTPSSQDNEGIWKKPPRKWGY